MRLLPSKYDGLSLDDLADKALKARQLLTVMSEMLREHEAEAVTRWQKQADTLLTESIDTQSLIGIVGATGAGKSALINALLDEECILPTNCMRACTSVPIEISYNECSSRYRATIEFVKKVDWKAELEILLRDVQDESGNLSEDCEDDDTDAGVALSKLQAVYADIDKHQFATLSVDDLLTHRAASNLDTIMSFGEDDSKKFQDKLRDYVDSKEKRHNISTSQGAVFQRFEVWPLIRVVRLYAKSDILRRGVQLVDLPGTHDSNAARTAVTQAYVKRCTGIFIVSTINRAVDDKSAQTLLGNAFKQQLKLDGNCGNVTFVCTQTDHISLTEVTRNLDLSKELDPINQKLEKLESLSRSLNEELSIERESLQRIKEKLKLAKQRLITMQNLAENVDREELVGRNINSQSSLKRRHTSAPTDHRKKRVLEQCQIFITPEETDTENDSLQNTLTTEKRRIEGLSQHELEAEIAASQQSIAGMKREKALTTRLVDSKEAEQSRHARQSEKLFLKITKICIRARNEYSRRELKRQYAKAMRQMDEQAAAENDPDNFDPSVKLQDYDKVAAKFPVYCVSSRAYQKLKGRLPKEERTAMFNDVNDTEIPQLQEHCCTAADALHKAAIQRFLNEADILRNSVKILALDHTGPLDHGTTDMEINSFAGAFTELSAQCLEDIAGELEHHVYSKVESAICEAKSKAIPTSTRWGSPINRAEPQEGGLHWQTYRAVTQCKGCYTNHHGTFDFNGDLAAPMFNKLLHGWDTFFHRSIPVIIETVSANFRARVLHFTGKLQNFVNPTSLQLLEQQLDAYAAKIDDTLQTAEKDIMTEKKTIHRLIKPEVSRAMSKTYYQCSIEKEAGMFGRMKRWMREGVTEAKEHMFESSTTLMRDKFLFMLKAINQTLCHQAEAVCENIRRDCVQVQGNRGRQVFKDSTLLKDSILRLIEEHETDSSASKNPLNADPRADVSETPGLSHTEEMHIHTLTKVENDNNVDTNRFQAPLGPGVCHPIKSRWFVDLVDQPDTASNSSCSSDGYFDLEETQARSDSGSDTDAL